MKATALLWAPGRPAAKESVPCEYQAESVGLSCNAVEGVLQARSPASPNSLRFCFFLRKVRVRSGAGKTPHSPCITTSKPDRPGRTKKGGARLSDPCAQGEVRRPPQWAVPFQPTLQLRPDLGTRGTEQRLTPFRGLSPEPCAFQEKRYRNELQCLQRAASS